MLITREVRKESISRHLMLNKMANMMLFCLNNEEKFEPLFQFRIQMIDVRGYEYVLIRKNKQFVPSIRNTKQLLCVCVCGFTEKTLIFWRHLVFL